MAHRRNLTTEELQDSGGVGSYLQQPPTRINGATVQCNNYI